MYIKVIPSTSAFNAFKYVHRPGSERIATDLVGASPRQLAQEMKLHNTLGPQIKHEVIHIPMSAARGEHLTAEQWLKAAQKVMRGLGYEGCPFDLVRHTDKESDHAHLLVAPIAPDGTRVSRRGDHYRAERVGREIERDLGLIRVEGLAGQMQRRAIERDLKITTISNLAAMEEVPERIVPAEGGLRSALEAAIRQALAGSKTFHDLARRLMTSGVRVEATISKAGKVIGLGYRLFGDQGGYMLASDIHESFSFAKLQKKHGLDFEETRDLPVMRRGAAVPIADIQALLAIPRLAGADNGARSIRDLAHHLMTSMNRRANANAPFAITRIADTDVDRANRGRAYHATWPSGRFPAGSAVPDSANPLSGGSISRRVAAASDGLPAPKQTVPQRSLGRQLQFPVGGLEESQPQDPSLGPSPRVVSPNASGTDVGDSGGDPNGRRKTTKGLAGPSGAATNGSGDGGGQPGGVGSASSGATVHRSPDASHDPEGVWNSDEAPAPGPGGNRLGSLGGPSSVSGVHYRPEDSKAEEVEIKPRLRLGSGYQNGLPPAQPQVEAPWGTLVDFQPAMPAEFEGMVSTLESDARASDPSMVDPNLAALEVVEQGYPSVRISPQEKARGPFERVAALVREAWKALEVFIRETFNPEPPEVEPELFDDELVEDLKKAALRREKELCERYETGLASDYSEIDKGRPQVKKRDPSDDPELRDQLPGRPVPEPPNSTGPVLPVPERGTRRGLG